MKDRKVVEKKVVSALNELLEKDKILLKINVEEETISHKLAMYLEKEFSGFDVDVEYNRQGKTVDIVKKLYMAGFDADSYGYKNVLPDIVIHNRGDNDKNTLVIEVKKSKNTGHPFDKDKEKLKAFVNNIEGGFNYNFGLFLYLFTGDDFDKKINAGENWYILEWFQG